MLLFNIIRILFPFHTATWAASSRPIVLMLNEQHGQRRDDLTMAWKDSMLSQLNVVGVTSALFGGVIATSITWQSVERLSISTRTTVTGVWYAALVFSLTSIATSAQQSVALSRLSCHPDGLRMIRQLLGRQDTSGAWKPRNLQMIIWQTPHSLLNTSIVMYAVSLGILVWSSVSDKWEWNDIRVVVMFTTAIVYTSVWYFMTTFWLYRQIDHT